MTELIVVCAVALVASALTLFSGFGLGTLLLPVFALFFPIGIAVAMTAVVHLANNLVKLALLGRHADRTIVRRFGLPAILASFLGARLLAVMSRGEPLLRYELAGRTFDVTAIGLSMGTVIALFALWDVLPRLKRVAFAPAYLPVGGALSGFFGGLSGHQGALRSAFLARAGLSREAFLGSGVAIACLVDVTRLALYGRELGFGAVRDEWATAAAAVGAATTGALIARRFVSRVSMAGIQNLIAVMLFAVAAALAAGWV